MHQQHIFDSPPLLWTCSPVRSTSLTFSKIDLLRRTVAGVSFLSTLPAFEKLSINITSNNFAQPFVVQSNTPNPRTTFPCLKSLPNVTESVTSPSQFVESWQTSRLKNFAIEQWTPSRVWDLKDPFSTKKNKMVIPSES